VGSYSGQERIWYSEYKDGRQHGEFDICRGVVSVCESKGGKATLKGNDD